MAENQSAGQTAVRAGRQTGNQGRRQGGPPTAVMQLNPERVPPLIAKWQKLLGKDLEKIQVEYEADSVSVYLFGKEGTPFEKKDKDDDPVSLSIPEYRELKAEANAPADDEKLRAFRDKFELRLNRPFPGNGPASGSEADIRAFLEGLEFHQRRAMLMSNKQFRTAYPNGFAQA
jgi:hypothetical protein